MGTFPLDTNCFQVTAKMDPASTLVLCSCPFETSSKDNAITWVKEIQKFRDSCQSYNPNTIMVNNKDSLNLSVGGETVNVSGEKLKDMAKSQLDSKAKDDENADDAKEARKASDLIYNVESMTVNAAKNAFFKSRLMQKEKEMKVQKDLKKLDELIEKEKQKEKCIKTFLEREGRRQRRKRLETDTEKELSQIKDQVKGQVDSLNKM